MTQSNNSAQSAAELLAELPNSLDVQVEYSKGSMLKRRSDGSVDFVSPLPCPYNYGFAEGRMGGDGDPLDVILLGARKPAGFRSSVAVIGIVEFWDCGQADHKVLCSDHALTKKEEAGLRLFFFVYPRFKSGLAKLRGQSGKTYFGGLIQRSG